MGKPANASFLGRNEFLIRRLHSLTGLVPVGAYMVVHLATNASIWNGVETFQNAVFRIHSLGPLLPLVEWAFIFLPLLFHGIVGLFILRESAPNTAAYPLGGNLRYTAQRFSGALAFLFIAYHVFHMHGWLHNEWWLETVATPFGGAQFKPYNAASTATEAMTSNVLIRLIYFIGVAACVFHLVNGLWTMGITWGLWTTPKAQRRADRVVWGVGVVIAAIGIAAWTGFNFAVKDTKEAQAIEDRMYEAQVEAGMVGENEEKRIGGHSSKEQAGQPEGDAE